MVKVKITLGDCMDQLEEIANESIDLVLCDPPYQTTSLSWDIALPSGFYSELKRVLKPNGTALIFGSQPFTSKVITDNLDWFRYELVWVKNKCSDFINANYRPMKKHENIIVLSKGKAAPGCKNPMVYNPQGFTAKTIKKNRQVKNLGVGRDRDSQIGEHESKGTGYPTSILEFRVETVRYHPTQKPVDLLEYLIRTYSNPGDTVLDPTAGSGSTGVACIKAERNFIGFEYSEKYFKVAKERLEIDD